MRWFTALAIVCLLPPQGLGAQWQARASIEGSAYRQPGPYDAGSLPPTEAVLTVDGSFFHEWNDGRTTLYAAPFLRLDPRGARTRVDLRDLNVRAIGDRWEVAIGMKDVFWGAAESRRLVDGVNQRDLVGGGEQYLRMGQLMANGTMMRPWGTVDLLVLPWFRERTFDAHSGMLWSPLPVDASRATYGPGAGPWRLDWAVRWRHTLGSLDVGFSHLQGNLREPRFVEVADGDGRSILAPCYDLGGQTGLDLQFATGRWLWKAEALTASAQPGRYLAAAGGLEYAIGDYLALFAEYAWDSRGREATTSFGDDFFLGGRLFLPDGEIGGRVFVDRRTFNTAASATASWRLDDRTTVGLEAGAFVGDSSLEPALGRRQHTRLSVRVSRWF